MRSLQGARYVIYRQIERVCYNASRRNACVTRRETRILRTDITSILQCKWTERVRYKARDTYFTDRTSALQYKQAKCVRAKAQVVASVKRGVRWLERARAQEKHGSRKLSAEAENAQPPGSCRFP